MTAQKSYRVPKKMREKYDAIVAQTDTVCRESLNGEYADLARKMTAALSRKRPSPLQRGQVRSWAAGIVYALGQVNFLFDKSEEPYMSASALSDLFDVSQNTASGKAKTIREKLDTGVMDPEWTLPSRVEGNPMAWMIQVDGFIVDARRMPREIQEEAYRQGLIPYLPEESGE
ncbi:MAG TPA: DUF6398 domain-containing protein [bacterium]|nr:DUF6398 domain-containing protein [bacterium]